ncbi:hypothetical protein OEZ49_18010 [Ruegeria sp. WL0004]|uniref:DUF2116 family Zn-ribbon domain-containing protein n=1 Tax=Ruegeria marisflavi TaxID=2984152 RepID=A0ABT2WUV0_9RHOB|nr:hypothetical protein [Ruegeria sp. WL0004]MCU9839673.1 hypothetical protein [Ruegeria sp. WL0004]
MLDATSPEVMAVEEISCPVCGIEFIPRRSNQQYCSRCCQKNATRGDRYFENFERSEVEAARARHLMDMLYGAPPGERLGVMKDILSFVPCDSGLRNILTRPELLRDAPFSSSRGRMNIAKAADAYTKMFFGVSIRTYVKVARTGAELPEAEVRSATDTGPVPNLRRRLTKKKVRCIHRPLREVPSTVTDEDYDRVASIVAEVQVRVDALADSRVSYDEEDCYDDAPPDDLIDGHDDDGFVTVTTAPGNSKREARRKIALSQACFDRGIGIDSPDGQAIALAMGINTL